VQPIILRLVGELFALGRTFVSGAREKCGFRPARVDVNDRLFLALMPEE
jgi:hypothetical protein